MDEEDTDFEDFEVGELYEGSQYTFCPDCHVDYKTHARDSRGVYVCDPKDLLARKHEEITKKRPRFYIIDLDNYNEDFLKEIILWQDEYTKLLEEMLGGKKE
jgi:hypothetical protein